MEKQNKLVVDVLKYLSQAGILDQVLLVGSWCAAFYREYFVGTDYNPVLRTRDIDFLTQKRPRFSKRIDLETLLSPLGFELEFFGKGFMKLESEELIIEFLVPEIGPHKEKPIELPELKFNAQPLRHLSMLWRNPIVVFVSGIKVRLPHPADYCLQKLIAASKRKRGDRGEKDRMGALEVLDALIEKEGLGSIQKALDNLSRSERKTTMAELEKLGRSEVLQESR